MTRRGTRCSWWPDGRHGGQAGPSPGRLLLRSTNAHGSTRGRGTTTGALWTPWRGRDPSRQGHLLRRDRPPGSAPALHGGLQNGARRAGPTDRGRWSCRQAPAYQVLSSQKLADIYTKPHQTTDDDSPPFNSAATTPDPASSNAGPQAADYQAGMRDGKADAASGARPTFADSSSHASPYVQGYSAGFGGGPPGPAGRAGLDGRRQRPAGERPGGPDGLPGGQGVPAGAAATSARPSGTGASQGDALPGGKLPIETRRT